MINKKILIVTEDFWPKNSPRSHRATELAVGLLNQGFEVHVLGDQNIEITESIEKQIGVKIFSFPKNKFFGLKPNNIFKLLFWYLGYFIFRYPQIQYYFYTRNTIPKLGGYDALITISSPFSIAWGIASFSKTFIKDKFKVWIADFGDPFMYSTALKYKPFFYFHYFEWNVMRKADFITVPFSDMKNFFYKKFSFKIKIIPQGVSLIKDLEEYKQNDPIKICFSGNIINGKRDIFSLLDYLILKEYKFIFDIFTTQPNLFENYKGNENYKINCREYIDRNELIKELSKMDFLVAVDLDESSSFVSAVPSKLIDYALSKRPILKYEQSKLPLETIDKFMNYSFEEAFIFDLDKHDNVLVTNQFIDLINCGKALKN
jgi:hypothetical protein